MSNENQLTNINNVLFEAIKSIVIDSRKRVYQNINRDLITTYWKIGEKIANAERQNKIDSQTSRQIILNLSKTLTKEIGRGFSRSNLFNMRKFHTEYPNVQTLSGQLSWSHICELLIIENKEKRSFYEKETVNSAWSIRVCGYGFLQ